MKKVLSRLFLFLLLTGCNSDASSGHSTDSSQLTEPSTSINYMNYFDYSQTPYKVGKSLGDNKIVCDNGEIFEYEYCGKDVMGFIRPMMGSLESFHPFDDNEDIIVFYVEGNDGKNYAKVISPIKNSSRYIRQPDYDGATRFEGFSDPADFYINCFEVIKSNMESAENLTVLTVDDAMDIFRQETNINLKEYQKKLSVCGEIYYSNPDNNHIILPLAFLSSSRTMDTECAATLYDVDNYCFTILQNKGMNYIIYLDGRIEETEMI